MKKKLESELVSIAHRILKLTGREDIDQLHKEVAVLYEKLTVLKFAQENFEDKMPTIGHDSSFFDMLDTAFNNKVSDNVEVEDRTYINLDEVEDDGIMEPVMTKIKDMFEHMPKETEPVDTLLKNALPEDIETSSSTEFESITSGFEDIPEFEPIEEAQKREAESEKKSLNDKLKGKRLNIGLNDKLAFIKHLFEGRNEDYDRVISQINTTNSLSEARTLILEMVKPDYNNWDGKEEYEERFIELVEGRFN
ncbi:hypothetical protein KO504_09225 [Winogradskyella psychrotolerans]|uniref:hypothetical protein n=1 Tax=Winogradskyella psychrotolerans TaxID=1344585 RepID=UPI001C079E48|nr:hypothetical protein [Winogradskyella psychrotolerans]MBU2921520.1 hypothetical protein [Winogradskyella psychrotolerans]|eukprot:TRINITY_DN101_c0_g1_i3.p1 TRINITY_DN101_c0_g1~~TRINITY_DN101_c0_g1_i3.p1  ORF type:complete len:251 (-),score=67.74 TRINITY_DN101_c0_g1_i3:458-1210(-)